MKPRYSWLKLRFMKQWMRSEFCFISMHLCLLRMHIAMLNLIFLCFTKVAEKFGENKSGQSWNRTLVFLTKEQHESKKGRTLLLRVERKVGKIENIERIRAQ